MKHCFVALPSHYEPVYLHDDSGDKVRQVLWGDWLRLDEDAEAAASPNSKWRTVLWAWNSPNKQRLKILREHTSETRPLEIVFVDVGQGDGAVLISAERDHRERIVVIDAGKGDHMREFLDRRFGAYRRGYRFHAAVITHPDNDHFLGFRQIFESGKIRFDTVYHNGLAERPVSGKWPKLGGHAKDPATKISYVAELTEDDAAMRTKFAPPVDAGRFHYATTIQPAIANDVVKDFRMLSTRHGQIEDGRSWMPGFGPSDDRGYTIEVIGPIVEDDPADGSLRLRKIGSYGETKNGHSVLLRLAFGDFSVLFGGDLNLKAEQFIMTQIAGMDWPQTLADREELIARVRPVLHSDVMKTCHHGSADVTDEFLEAVNPAAFVISSGDEEGHVHPRPDLLGRLGKMGRGSSPVLLSTELQRSTREKEDEQRVAALKRQVEDLETEEGDDEAALRKAREELRKAIHAEIDALCGTNVTVDGAIYVKTDGKRLIAAFKKELQSPTDKWFYFEYRIVNDRLILAPRGH